MKLDAAPGGEFIVIGENMHTTRVVMRRGARFAADGAEGGPAVRYADSGGAARLLSVPGWAARTQDFEEGRVKHIAIAVRGAMEGDAECERYLRAVVAAQEAADADFLDVNVDEISVKFDEQTAAMAWLVRFVQAASRLPVSVDSSNVDIIAAGLAACAEGGPRPLLNSASLERMDALDLALRHGAQVVVTAAGDSGMPDGAAQRIDNASRMVEAARARGFADSDIYIDPALLPHFGRWRVRRACPRRHPRPARAVRRRRPRHRRVLERLLRHPRPQDDQRRLHDHGGGGGGRQRHRQPGRESAAGGLRDGPRVRALPPRRGRADRPRRTLQGVDQGVAPPAPRQASNAAGLRIRPGRRPCERRANDAGRRRWRNGGEGGSRRRSWARWRSRGAPAPSPTGRTTCAPSSRNTRNGTTTRAGRRRCGGLRSRS